MTPLKSPQSIKIRIAIKSMEKQIHLFILMALCSSYIATGQVVVTGSHASFLREGDKSFITATINNKSNNQIINTYYFLLNILFLIGISLCIKSYLKE